MTGGVLSGGGAAAVIARTYLAPVPQIVPHELNEALEPVRDEDDILQDWRLDRSRIIARGVSAGELTRLSRVVADFRGTYVLERPLGDVATVRAFVAWAQTRTDISALRGLLAPPVRVDPATATRAARQVQAAAVAARSSDETAVIVTVPGRDAPVRGFIPGTSGVIVAATRGAHLTATRDGLTLTETGLAHAQRPMLTLSAGTSGGPDPSTDRAGGTGGTGTYHTEPVRQWQVRGWGMTANGIMLRRTARPNEPVALGDSAGARLLLRVAPGAPSADVYPAPVTSVFAQLLLNLPEVALAAARQARPLLVTTNP